MARRKPKKEKAGQFAAQMSYEDRQRAKGLCKVGAWVPIEQRDELLDIAESMRVKAGKN